MTISSRLAGAAPAHGAAVARTMTPLPTTRRCDDRRLRRGGSRDDPMRCADVLDRVVEHDPTEAEHDEPITSPLEIGHDM